MKNKQISINEDKKKPHVKGCIYEVYPVEDLTSFVLTF